MPNTSYKTPSIFGGILLIIGNIVGAGILALPLATAQLGIVAAIFILFIFWLLMTSGAYYLLEVNLALPAGSNLISMSKMTLGKWGVAIAWICNLLVMYSLIAAYISGGGDLIKTNFSHLNITLPSWVACVFFLGVFGFIVSRGIHLTDHTNRIFMLLKLFIFFGVLIGLTPHASVDTLSIFPQKNLSAPLLIIVITSFGFATLIPSLRSYYQSDVKKLKKIIFWGTFIPLLLYTLWITLIFFTVPYDGIDGLAQISTSTHPVSDLQFALNQSLHISWITQATNIFSAVCIITSFLANSISLTDFIADGFQLYSRLPSGLPLHTTGSDLKIEQNKKTWLVYLIAYLPALCAVLFYEKAFLLGLSIAGFIAIIQLLILPACMTWSLRYRKKHVDAHYFVMGGKPLLVLLLASSFALLFFSLFS